MPVLHRTSNKKRGCMEGDDVRRKGDRRKAQVPFEGEDRRRADRRSGGDRRAQERKATGPEE